MISLDASHPDSSASIVERLSVKITMSVTEEGLVLKCRLIRVNAVGSHAPPPAGEFLTISTFSIRS